MSDRRPLAVQLFSFRDYIADDPVSVLRRIVEMGFVGVEVLSATGLPHEAHEALARWTVEARELKRMLDDLGLLVCGAHTALPEGPQAAALLDEQGLLGNDVLIVSSLGALPGGLIDDLDRLDTLKRVAERFNQAAALAAERGMRVGYHNHFWEWRGSIDGRPGWEVFWDQLDPSVVAEVDVYWAQVAGRDPAQVIADLGSRAQFVHVKDGPLKVGEPMVAVGSGDAEVASALAAGKHLRWHIVEVDECASDPFDVVEQSARWLVEHGFSLDRNHVRVPDRVEP